MIETQGWDPAGADGVLGFLGLDFVELSQGPVTVWLPESYSRAQGTLFWKARASPLPDFAPRPLHRPFSQPLQDAGFRGY